MSRQSSARKDWDELDLSVSGDSNLRMDRTSSVTCGQQLEYKLCAADAVVVNHKV